MERMKENERKGKTGMIRMSKGKKRKEEEGKIKIMKAARNRGN